MLHGPLHVPLFYSWGYLVSVFGREASPDFANFNFHYMCVCVCMRIFNETCACISVCIFQKTLRLTVLHAPIHVPFFYSWGYVSVFGRGASPNISKFSFLGGTWLYCHWMRTSPALLQRLFFPNEIRANSLTFISSKNHRISSSRSTSTLAELIDAWPATSLELQTCQICSAKVAASATKRRIPNFQKLCDASC